MVKQIVMNSHPDQLPEVEQFIELIRSELEFKDDVYGNVMVAVTEAVNNSIHHGNAMEQGKRVFISCEKVSSFRIVVSVKDEGKGFDPEGLPDPTAPENLENPGGRGVFLMRHLADSIEFDEGGRLVRMFFNI